VVETSRWPPSPNNTQVRGSKGDGLRAKARSGLGGVEGRSPRLAYSASGPKAENLRRLSIRGRRRRHRDHPNPALNRKKAGTEIASRPDPGSGNPLGPTAARLILGIPGKLQKNYGNCPGSQQCRTALKSLSYRAPLGTNGKKWAENGRLAALSI